MARHVAHRLEHPWIVNASGGDLMLDHLDAPIAIVHTVIVAVASAKT
jgi:hypothetical protein